MNIYDKYIRWIYIRWISIYVPGSGTPPSPPMVMVPPSPPVDVGVGWMNICIYVYVNRRLSPRLYTGTWSWSGCFSDDGTRVAASAWQYFLPVLQWSWAKGASWRRSLRAELCGSVQCSVAYTLFAPPTHGQLCRPRAKECPLNWSIKSAAVHLLNYGELKSVQNFKSTWRLATVSTKR